MFLALIWWGMRWQTDCFWHEEKGQFLYHHKGTIWWDLLCQEALGQLSTQSFGVKSLFPLSMCWETLRVWDTHLRKGRWEGTGGEGVSSLLACCCEVSVHGVVSVCRCPITSNTATEPHYWQLSDERPRLKSEWTLDLLGFFLKVVGVMKVVKILPLFLL